MKKMLLDTQAVWHRVLLTVPADGHVIETIMWLNEEEKALAFDPHNDLKCPSNGSKKKHSSSGELAHIFFFTFKHTLIIFITSSPAQVTYHKLQRRMAGVRN